MSSHLFHLASTPPQTETEFGSLIEINRLDFPILSHMALSLLELKPNGFREPHWHPDANTLAYCLEGRALISLFTPESGHDTFLVEPGSLAFIPIGALHSIQNIGNTHVKILLCADNDEPDEIDFSSSIAAMPETILAATCKLSESFFTNLNTSLKPAFITQKRDHPQVLDAWKTNRYKFHIEANNPEIQSAAGWVKMSNAFLMPTLNGLAMYTLQLNPQGAREPHWHPNSHELNYLVSGSAKVAIFSPGGKVDLFEMKAGDMSFIPQGCLHTIETIGTAPARFAVFYNNASPTDIGLSKALGTQADALFVSLFKLPPAALDSHRKDQSGCSLIVGGG